MIGFIGRIGRLGRRGVRNAHSGTHGIVNSFRYVRFTLGRSTANAGAFLNELQVIDVDGVNRALGRHDHLDPAGVAPWTQYPLIEAFNGEITSSKTWGLGYHKHSHVLDLGDSYALSEIRMYPFYLDKRTFQDVGLEVSNDQETWYLIHDSEGDGTASRYHGRIKGSGLGIICNVPYALAFLDNPIRTIPEQFRYVRLRLGRSEKNTGIHVNEFEVRDSEGKNLLPAPNAFNITPYYSGWSIVLDGDDSVHVTLGSANWGEPDEFLIDLEAFHSIDQIKLVQYYKDERTYGDNSIALSDNQTDWHTVYDSEATDGVPYHGRHVSTKDGLTLEMKTVREFWKGSYLASGYVADDYVQDDYTE